MLWIYRIFLRRWANNFQNGALVRLENWYEKRLRAALSGRWPFALVGGIFLLLFFALIKFGISLGSGETKTEFFPDNLPNQIVVYIEYPEGTDIEKTDAITKEIEQRVFSILNDALYIEGGNNFMVESSVSQVGEGAGNPMTDMGSAAETPHKAKITASMREFKYRKGNDSEELRQKVQEALVGIYPGVLISVEKDAQGPAVGHPINIEIQGDNYNELIATAESMRNFINSKNIGGIDELKIDVNKDKPSMQVSVDRKKAGELGVSASQIGQQLRNSIFGAKAGIYKEDGEDYDIYVRFNQENRYSRSALFNQPITFRDMSSGQIRTIPISALAKPKNNSGFSAIKHRDVKRVVTLYSALAPGFIDPVAIVNQIQAEMRSYPDPLNNIKIDYTGQIEEMQKQQSFLNLAFIIGLGLIFFILIFQFNSVSKPAIIMMAIFLSFIGVFGGILIFNMSFVIMMSMMGIIALAGIVVNNGVVLLDYTQLLIDRKKVEQNLDKDEFVDKNTLFEAIVRGGKARLRPVILTAITTILGLIPLAVGININFFTLMSDLDPNIYIGGDNVVFWGPLAWAVIFGLLIATFLTLIIVPTLFYLITRFKMWLRNKMAPEETKAVVQ
jgi:multidrug efflux pump subunit AcrB